MRSDSTIKKQLSAQLLHWEQAIERLMKLDDVASPDAWRRLERETNTVLRASIQKSVRTLGRKASKVRMQISEQSPHHISKAIHDIRRDYLRTETVLDFFADAINSRSSPNLGTMLRGLDTIASNGMREILQPLGYATPPVICYIDKGLGASILKAGLRLWDRRSFSPTASVKVVRHNVLTATSVLHEIGHQIAYMVGWNRELANALQEELPAPLGRVWGSWSPEIAADALAYAYAGHASISALRNVVDGGDRQVFRFIPMDPHPIGMVRVLMVCHFARLTMPKTGRFVGENPWLELEQTWVKKYPLKRANRTVAQLIAQSIPLLPEIARITLKKRFNAFGNKSLVDIVDPKRVSPGALERFERAAGPKAFALPHVVRREPIRLLALSGLRIATSPERGREYYEKQQSALGVLGAQAIAA